MSKFLYTTKFTFCEKFDFRDNRVCLILVSRDRSPESFHAMQDCRTAIVQKLTKKKMFEHLSKPSEDYTVSDVGIIGLKNFIYLRFSTELFNMFNTNFYLPISIIF